MNTTLQRYAPALLSFLVLVIGGLQAAVAGGLTIVALVQVGVLTITTATTFLVPLIDARWQGAVKTGLELLGLAITTALPFIVVGTITPAEILLIVVAVLKSGAAELGVQIRTDTTAPPVEVVVTPQHRAE